MLKRFALGRRSPDDQLGRMREETTGEVRAGVGLVPGDGVEQMVAQLLHRKAERKDDVLCARDPDGPGRLENATAGRKPTAMELVIGTQAGGGIPLSFVDRHPAARLAGGAAVGQVVGRVGKDQVDRACRNPIEQLQAVALDEPVIGAAMSNGRCWKKVKYIHSRIYVYR